MTRDGLLGKLVERGRLLTERRRHIGDVFVHRAELGRCVRVEQLRELVLPRVAVCGERALERRRVDPANIDNE